MSSERESSSSSSKDDASVESSEVSGSDSEVSQSSSVVEEVKVDKSKKKSKSPAVDKKIEDLTIEDTFVGKAYEKKIPKKFYQYYYIHPDPEFEDLVKHFEPGEDDLEMFKGTKKRNRMIYPVEKDKYLDWEIEKFDEFYEFLVEEKFEGLKDIDMVHFEFSILLLFKSSN